MPGESFARDLNDQEAEFLNVDFWTEANRLGKSTGVSEPRNLAMEPCGTERPKFADVNEVIPESQWDDLMDQKDAEESWLSDLIAWVHDQDGEGSCVTEAYTATQEIKIVETLGLDEAIELSAASLYHFTGSSPGSGSNLSTNLRRMKEVGCLPRDTAVNKTRFEHTHVAVGQRASLPQGFEKTAAIFKYHEYLDIESINEAVSAILKNKPFVYARSSHCITGVRLLGRLRLKNLRIGYLNSWGEWGAKLNARFNYGLGIDSYSTVARVASGGTCLSTIGLPEELLKKVS